MKENEILLVCKEYGCTQEGLKNLKFVLKRPEKLKNFYKKLQEKYERELSSQKGLFQ